MKKSLLLTILFLLCLVRVSLANDGVFYASGNTLVPLQETQIQLKREVLKFFVIEHEFVNVEIAFDFYNPGNAKTVTVGFLTPPASGDILDEDAKHPFISDFTVNANGKVPAYKIKKLSETSFRMGEAEVQGDDFVYYFPVTFKKGLNKILHTYRFRGGSGVEMQRDFSYQITTGKRWANRRIDDFELQIHLDHGIFAIPASFQKDAKSADWKIIGDGIIEENPRKWFSEENPKVRMVHLNEGFLSFKAKNFKPDNDLFFGEYNWGAGWTNIWCNQCFEAESLEKIVRFFNLNPSGNYETEDFAELSPKELKYIRNYFYAVRGFPFKDAELKKFYSQFFWYKPNESVKIENIHLSKAEASFIEVVKKAESKKSANLIELKEGVFYKCLPIEKIDMSGKLP